MSTIQGDGENDGLPLEEGVAAGAGAFLGGYLITLVLLLVDDTGEITQNTIDFAGWVYYNAQFVPIEFEVMTVESINFLREGWEAATIPAVVYHLVPVVVLVLAGFALASYVGTTEIGQGAKAGASIVPGTVILVIGGTMVFSSQGGSPALFESVLLAGVLYPAICGAIGGALSVKLRLGA